MSSESLSLTPRSHSWSGSVTERLHCGLCAGTDMFALPEGERGRRIFLPCGHEYHSKCLMRAGRVSNSADCAVSLPSQDDVLRGAGGATPGSEPVRWTWRDVALVSATVLPSSIAFIAIGTLATFLAQCT